MRDVTQSKIRFKSGCASLGHFSLLVSTTPLEPEDSRFVLPGQSPESREVMHAIVIHTG